MPMIRLHLKVLFIVTFEISLTQFRLEFLFAFDNTDESTLRLCLANEQVKSYDLDWLTKSVF